MPAPNEAQVLNTITDFAAANPAGTLGDARDELVAAYGGLPVHAINAVTAAFEEYVKAGFDNDPDPLNASWGKLRNRCAAVGQSVARNIGKCLRPAFGSRNETRIYILRIQRDELVASRNEYVTERTAVQDFRDTQYPSGNPGAGDPSGQYVYQQLTSSIQGLNQQIQEFNSLIDQIDVTIASLGG